MQEEKKKEKKIYTCEQCHKKMNIVDYFVNAVCIECCRRNQKEILNFYLNQLERKIK